MAEQQHPNNLIDLVGEQTLAIAANYTDASNSSDKETEVYICGADVRYDSSLTLTFPKGHNLKAEQLITVHLDNRTGVSEYDAELKVYRLSYKGKVTSTDCNKVEVEPIEFQVFYGISVIMEYRAPGYEFPADDRVEQDLIDCPIEQIPEVDSRDHHNKIGVLVSMANGQPHTTVLAFLSTMEDDIFFITFPNTFKSKLLKRDPRCFFAIDNRGTFTFDQAIEWNYTIIQGNARKVAKDSTLFHQIQNLFILKNPFEVGFFAHPEVEMYHISPQKVVCAAKRDE